MIVLIGLNAASYRQKPKETDNEYSPNRSSYNAGATGTRAFYEMLGETGRKVVRWQEPPDALLANKNAPNTFVVVGSLRREFTDIEIKNLLQWVSRGGKLVIIDREPPDNLVGTTADWNISLAADKQPQIYAVDAADPNQLTDKTAAVKPVQPTVFTQNVNAVQPSIFASSVVFEAMNEDEKSKHYKETANGIGSGSSNQPPPPAPPPIAKPSPTIFDENYSDNKKVNEAIKELDKAKKEDKTITVTTEKKLNVDSSDAADQSYPPAFTAPVVHLANDAKNLLVDVPYNSGEIVYLSDPFIVANNGINLADNAQLAINIVGSNAGTIAFDEYHQGFGANTNRFLEYFAGTPVVAIFLQILLLIGLLFFSQSRRFARAVPEYEPNRLSKLEYVAAMAELQQRSRAFDLAVENIYADFRRRAARLLGFDNRTTAISEMARLIAERTKYEAAEIAELLQKCEDIMHGAPTNKKEVLRLTTRLREVEEKLGLRRNRSAKTN